MDIEVEVIKSRSQLKQTSIGNIQVHKQQFEFITKSHFALGYIGGYGSGKTFSGSIRAVIHILKYPKILGCIATGTHQQLAHSTLRAFKQVLISFNIQENTDYVVDKAPPKWWGIKSQFMKSHDGVITFKTGAQLKVISLERFDVHEGLNLGWVWIDEGSSLPEAAIKMLISRLRGQDGLYPDFKYNLWITSFPNGHDHLWKMFESNSKLPDSWYTTSTSYDNIFLDESYAKRTEDSLGKDLAKQRIFGCWDELTSGRVFTFSRHKNIKTCLYNPEHVLIFSCDFNVSPLCGVVLQFNSDDKIIHVIDEIFIPNGGQTKVLCQEFVRRYAKYRPRYFEYEGDSAGAARSTRTERTDIDILQAEIGTFMGGANMTRINKKTVYEGVQSINALLDPSTGEPRLFIDNKCEHLIQDLEQLNWVPGTRIIDKKTNKNLSHLTDALRYSVIRIMPVHFGGMDMTRFMNG